MEYLKAERAESHTTLLKDLNSIKMNHNAAVDNLQIQLNAAKMQLQEVHEFTLRKCVIEEQIASLKEQLHIEKRKHEEAVRDVERFSFQEHEKLKREMASCIEYMNQQMRRQTEEQLHSNTKRTISANEQLAKELAYHMKQRDVLALKNHQLIEENAQLEHKLVSAKKEQKEIKELIVYNEQLKANFQGEQKELESLKKMIEEKTSAGGSIATVEEVVKFLYVCLEDLDLKMLDKLPCGDFLASNSDKNQNTESPPTSLAQLDTKKRQDFLEHLLRTAISLRAVKPHIDSNKSNNESEATSLDVWSHVLSGGYDKPNVSVEDIMALKNDLMHLDDAVAEKPSNCSTTSSIQTNWMVMRKRPSLSANITEHQKMSMSVINIGF
ncbi:hypothetical protein O6H91_07G080900 [Diphasiastrum complanatum]|uniref:Uncharacterized protein n=3 Tax=Diphasiastrum complanatum TaxID=34168 RepID=A0ACC2D7G6_DIPCM|nr:hypothetical protein O6H91_07G080900 [Diphasiastrum complanatum]KAJ7550057.1 hypothetical protein O6H91_07G080900 [Diphasiastrum complanatum]KAJ7550058.1 hypothetical protein O6H91_07G080900 [Diphasiastrum complanatum]